MVGLDLGGIVVQELVEYVNYMGLNICRAA